MYLRLANCELALCAALLTGAGCSVQAENGSAAGKRVTPPRTAGPGTFTGVGSCASAGCHGRPFDGQKRNWKTAYSVWLSEDPHCRAFQVLYTERSVEMYRNLHSEAKLADVPPGDRAYLEFLEQRCIGCHATPRPSEASAAHPSANSPNAYVSGIHCESCHGAAGGWVHDHYVSAWPKPGTAKRASLNPTGFRDTKDLWTRAGVCVDCHVGPQIRGIMYDVDHELIAAGHPRLTFEFDAYLENYPKHWDAAADVARHQKQSGGSYHVDAWRFGQEQLGRQLVNQISLRQYVTRSTVVDFSSYECFDCHHALGAAGHHGAAARGGMPRPALEPLATLELLHGRRIGYVGIATLLEGGLRPDRDRSDAWAAHIAETHQAIAASSLPSTDRAALPKHAGLLVLLLDRRPLKEITFDQAVQFYLAVQALVRDLPDGVTKQALTSASDELLAALSDPASFAVVDGRVTQYDSPAEFCADKVAPHLEKVRSVLENIQNSSRTVPAP